jgi:outer membrane receptor protein involved in Fe transport
LTVFTYRADRLVEQRSTGGPGDDLYFANGGVVEGSGVEAEVEARLARGVNAYIGYTFTSVHDVVNERVFSNSPRHLSKIGVQLPIADFHLGLEGQYIGPRLSLGGEEVEGAFVPNVTLTSPARRRVSFSISINNAFNTSYADPGAEEHLQQAIPQDGRTLLARVRVKF